MEIKTEDITHWNIWFTDELLKIMSDLPYGKLRELFRPYATHLKMSNFFALKKNYLQDKRRLRWANKSIALNLLEIMKISVRNRIKKWKNSYPLLFKELNEVEIKFNNLINSYQKLFNPKSTSFSWIQKYHPNLDVYYFSNVETLQQAYWLGYLIADGWITLIQKPNNNYYEIGFGQNIKDIERVFKFVKDLGLNKKYVKIKLINCPLVQSRKKSIFSVITFYSGNINDKKSMANNLINLGMKYDYNVDKCKRKKVPELVILKNHDLMISYLLGLYDGDGTLAYNKKDGRTLPSISSSNIIFLKQIRDYFKINNKIQKTRIKYYDYNRNIILKGAGYRIILGKEIFKQLMSIKVDSMKRKRISLEMLNKPKLTKQRKWLALNFTGDELDSLLNVISPTRASKLLGIHRETFVSFAKKIYNIEILDKSYYNQLATYHQIYGKKVPFYSELMYWTKFLRKIGKYSNIVS